MHSQPFGSPSPSPRTPSSNPLAATSPRDLAPDLHIPESALSPLPSEMEVLRYRTLAQKLIGTTSSKEFAELVQASFSLRDRLKGEGATSGSGGLKISELRVEWATHAERALTDLYRILPDVYRSAPATIIATVASDFAQRLSSKGVRFTKTHIQSAMSECLEQTRLMVIFAGRALKSDEHIQSSLSGLKGKSFAEAPGGPSSNQGPLDASTRQSNFEQRQRAKLAAAEERKQALRSGGAAPAKDVKPKPAKDEFKSELLSQTAGDYAKLCRESQPSEEQRALLSQRPIRELEARLEGRLTKPKGALRGEELETLRVEITNEVARLIRSWLDQELNLAQSFHQETLTVSGLSQDASSALVRKGKCATHHAALGTLLSDIDVSLAELAKSDRASGGTLGTLLTREEVKRLEALLTPPEEKQTYELA